MSEVWSRQLPVLADTSAWGKVSHAPPDVHAYWAEAILTRQVYVSPVVRLELLHHAGTAVAVNERDNELDQMPQVPLTQDIASTAITAILELAPKSDGYHRVRAPDALIAATASLFVLEPLAVLHQDDHYDKLAEVLNFTPYSLVPASSLETDHAANAAQRTISPRITSFHATRTAQITQRT